VADHLLETQPIIIMENTARAMCYSGQTRRTGSWHRRLWTPTKTIRWAIESFGSFKSAGEDGIVPALLKNEIEILSGPLVKIFTACLALRYIPEAWQRVRVIFIPKPRRTSYELA
jgi:hypothetical protein